MPSHISESLLYGASFSTPEFLAIFNDENRVQTWFDVEVALAQAQAELGMIPAAAATEIAAKAKVEQRRRCRDRTGHQCHRPSHRPRLAGPGSGL